MWLQIEPNGAYLFESPETPNRWSDGDSTILYRDGEFWKLLMRRQHFEGLRHCVDPAGTYLQSAKNPYNPDGILNTVSLRWIRDDVSVIERLSTMKAQGGAAGETCRFCEHFLGGDDKQTKCAKSCKCTKSIALLTGRCPISKWDNTPIAKPGNLLTPADSVDEVLAFMDGAPVGSAPKGWSKWGNVQDAHRRALCQLIEGLPVAMPATLEGSGRGVVTCGGGKYFASLYVSLRVLRHVGCTLPVEAWYLGRNHEMSARYRELLEGLGARCIDADYVRQSHPARILNGWELKAYAVQHSAFSDVIFMDSDSYPARDPRYLFDEPAYQQKGAIFWPDDIPHDLSARVWAAFGIPARREPSVESGQFVVNRHKCWRELAVAMWLNERSDYTYGLVHGDKETFHLAWRKLGTDYAMPPKRWAWSVHTMIQHDLQGRPLFNHRCRDKFRLGQKGFGTTPQTFTENRRNPKLEHEEFAFQALAELKGMTEG